MKMEIQTERLVLRPPQAEDAAQIAEYMSDPDLPLNLGRAKYPYKLEYAEAWIPKVLADYESGAEYAFMIDRPGKGLVGSCGLTRVGEYWEIGYWLGKPHWGKGYISEAAAALLDWGTSTLGAKGFLSGHIKENAASGQVLQKLGFKVAGEIDYYIVSRDCEVRAIRYVRGAPPEAALQSNRH